MALAELLAVIEADADAQMRAERTAGEADARAIEAAAASERAVRAERARGAWRAEVQGAADRQVAAARHRARVAVLEARAAMLDRVRAEVRPLLPGFVDEPLERAFLRVALACASGPGVIRAAPAIAAAAQVPPDMRVEPDPAIATGVVIELATGTRIVATLEALFDREWPRLAATALALVDAEPAA